MAWHSMAWIRSAGRCARLRCLLILIREPLGGVPRYQQLEKAQMHSDGFVSQARETIIHFPLAHRRQLVRSAACRLDQLNGQAATDFWKTLCSRLKTELFDTGQTYEDVRREILAFQAEVHRELFLLYEPNGCERSLAAT